MSKVDDELTRRLHRAERRVDVDAVFEGLARRRSHRERVRRVQAGLLAFAVLAATAGGFLFLRDAFDTDKRNVGGEHTPSVANGEIVFSAEGNDGYTHLYAVQPDGSGRRQITDFGTNDTDPSVSPDGRTIAFIHQLEDVNPTIASIPITGGTVTWLMDPEFEGSSPTWSPDGTEVLIVGGRTGLYSISSNGSDRRTVISFTKSPVADPSWSPDGSLIVFAGQDGSLPPAGRQWSLTIVTRDGKFITDVSGSNEDARSPAWSPDGSLIAFLAPHAGGTGIWTIPAPGGGEPSLIATTSRLENDLTWAPDGSSLLASDGEWIYRVTAQPTGDPAENLVRVVRGSSPAWQPLPVPSSEPEPSSSPSREPEGRDIGLGFNVCNLAVLGGIDFLGDGTDGRAWTATKVEPNGRCPSTDDGTNGVAVDFTGDGEADSWSETIEHCTMCGPFMARDLNEDGTEEVIITLQGGSIMQYGIYTVMPVDGRLQVVPFTTGEPGHDDAGHIAGEPFTFWVGGDEGSSYWFHCEALPEFRLTDTYTPVDGGANAETTVHETHVSLGTDGIAEILDAQTYTVSEVVVLEYATSKPDCGLGVDIWRLQAPA
jgi:Tol biopolymer transport system component